MYRFALVLLTAGAALAGCTTYPETTVASNEPPPAPIPPPSFTPIEGAILGQPAGGMPGAIWADGDGDGYVDGYYYNGQFYRGVPPALPAGAVRRGERG